MSFTGVCVCVCVGGGVGGGGGGRVGEGVTDGAYYVFSCCSASCLLFSLYLRPLPPPLLLSTIFKFFCSLIKPLLSAGLYPRSTISVLAFLVVDIF